MASIQGYRFGCPAPLCTPLRHLPSPHGHPATSTPHHPTTHTSSPSHLAVEGEGPGVLGEAGGEGRVGGHLCGDPHQGGQRLLIPHHGQLRGGRGLTGHPAIVRRRLRASGGDVTQAQPGSPPPPPPPSPPLLLLLLWPQHTTTATSSSSSSQPSCAPGSWSKLCRAVYRPEKAPGPRRRHGRRTTTGRWRRSSLTHAFHPPRLATAGHPRPPAARQTLASRV